jgi:hypothetical protein
MPAYLLNLASAYFEVAAGGGEILFSTASFIEEHKRAPSDGAVTDPVGIDVLKVVSRRIVDAYGIRVGSRHNRRRRRHNGNGVTIRVTHKRRRG